MPRDGAGTYTQPASSVSPAVTNTTISSVDFNNLMTDISTEVTDSFDRSGKGAMLAALAMGGFKIVNLGSPASGSEAARLDNITGFALTGDVTGTPGANTVSNVAGSVVSGLTAGTFATAGKVGQVISSSATIGLTTGTPAAITSIALTAGNWLIHAVINSGPGGATNTLGFQGAINLSSAVIAAGVTNAYTILSPPVGTQFGGPGQVVSWPLPTAIVSISGTTSYFLNVQMGFSGGTMNAGGIIFGVRI